jgi:hypothetical protein
MGITAYIDKNIVAACARDQGEPDPSACRSRPAEFIAESS